MTRLVAIEALCGLTLVTVGVGMKDLAAGVIVAGVGVLTFVLLPVLWRR